MQPEFGEYPAGFLWGVATSAHQVEGGNAKNQWWEWELKNAKRLAEEAGPDKDYGNGRGMAPNIWYRLQQQIKDPRNYFSGDACCHYDRFESDLDLAQELGIKAYRFSLEWSRIEPKPGYFSLSAIEHYRQVIWACESRGIKPVVSLWHWTHPLWFEEMGAWESSEAVAIFERYAEAVAAAFAQEPVHLWLVLNEPEVYNLLSYAPAWMAGCPWPPQRSNLRAWRRVGKRLVEAHKAGYDAIKRYATDAKVSSAVNLSHNEAVPGWWRLVTKASLAMVNYGMWDFHRQTMSHQDFIGLNYYMHQVFLGRNPFGGQEATWTSDLGWELYPEGLYHVLTQLNRRYPDKEIYITEHGLADCLDESRAEYIRQSLGWCLKAIHEGVRLRGYMHWSLLDNFEWDKGFWPQFGLIKVDRQTQEREFRSSARYFAKIISSNTVA